MSENDTFIPEEVEMTTKSIKVKEDIISTCEQLVRPHLGMVQFVLVCTFVAHSMALFILDKVLEMRRCYYEASDY